MTVTSLRNITVTSLILVTAVPSLRNITLPTAPLIHIAVTQSAHRRKPGDRIPTLATVAPLRNIAVTVTTVASLRKSLLRESGHSPESFLRSAATARGASLRKIIRREAGMQGSSALF